MHLAIRGEEISTIQEIADSFDISRAHLMKVVHRLGLLGYVTTIRGKNGGLKLLRAPAGIRVGAVVRDTEEDLSVLGCLAAPDYCVIAKACVLRGAFREATETFLAVLDGYTLADLVKPRNALAGLLHISEPHPKRAKAS
jgi:Rrf2 family nitric oxide-sensitive transcriptional repressor